MATAKFHQQMIKLKEFFGDMSVSDAKADLHIQPNEEDIRTAVPGDPQNCAFSRACQRMYGSKGALFLGRSAYVDLLDEQGRSVVRRHILSRTAQDFIDNIDAKARCGPLASRSAPRSGQRRARFDAPRGGNTKSARFSSAEQRLKLAVQRPRNGRGRCREAAASLSSPADERRSHEAPSHQQAPPQARSEAPRDARALHRRARAGQGAAVGHSTSRSANVDPDRSRALANLRTRC
jgi:hypothetical protein